MPLKDQVTDIRNRAEQEFLKASHSKELYELKVKYLGKQGEFSQIMKQMGKLSKEERPEFGKIVNIHKADLEKIYENTLKKLKIGELKEQIKSEKLDLTLPGPWTSKGSTHPVTKVIYEITDILSRLGYSVKTGPHIEKDYYNFEALNIPSDHPSRDEQDTFYIDEDHVLRTQTSPIQIRTMEKEKPPFRIVAPGSVFRSDNDISHSPNFHQIEGLLVDKKVSMADLRGTISYFVNEFFAKGSQTRFRPSFFPFTEPSAEVDCTCFICKGAGCSMCKQTGWIEIGGSGLVNPKVLEMSGINSEEWQGFAFGFGIERMAIIKYGIEHIRLFSDNNLQFLKQFS